MARGSSTEPTILSQEFRFGYDTALTKLISQWRMARWHITEAHHIPPGMSSLDQSCTRISQQGRCVDEIYLE